MAVKVKPGLKPSVGFNMNLIKSTAEQGADHRAEQVVHQFVWQGAEADFQVGSYPDGIVAEKNGHGAEDGAGGDGVYVPEFTVGIRKQREKFSHKKTSFADSDHSRR